jgi:hypothetical protein
VAYMTHVSIPGLNPCYQFASLMDLLVDRNRGNTVHKQYRQQAGSVSVLGAWVHMADIRGALDKGYIGTLRVCREQYENGLGKITRLGETVQDAMEYVL